MIHPTAIVDPGAELADSVTVGPWSIIGSGVVLGEACTIASHVCITGPTRMGRGNHIFPFASIGTDPQDKKYTGEADSELLIGDGNTIRELVTINRGTSQGGGRTVIGDNNCIMAYTHIAHDCVIGNHTVLCNRVVLAGHVVVEDFVVLSGGVGIHQFCRVGSYSFSASGSVIARDVPPFVLVRGDRARPYGLNREGMRRNGFSSQEVGAVKEAYRCLYLEGRKLRDAVEGLEELALRSQSVAMFLRFVRSASRGLVR